MSSARCIGTCSTADVSIRKHTSACPQPDASSPAPQHTSAYVSIRQHTSARYIGTCSTADVSIRKNTSACPQPDALAPAPQTSAYVSIRQHTSAYVSMSSARCIGTCYTDVSIRKHTSAYVSIRLHVLSQMHRHLLHPPYVSRRQHT